MKKKVRRPSPIKRVAKGLGYVAFLAVSCGVGVVADMARRSTLVHTFFSNPLALLNADPRKTFHKQDGLTLLILGTDDDRVQVGWSSGNGEPTHSISKVTRRGARADMILLAHLDFAKNTITGLSIPRDTACRLPEARYRARGQEVVKINGYYGRAPKGEEKATMERAVEYLLPGVQIDRTIALNYDGFQELVNTIGGVPVVVPKGMKGEGLQYDDWSGDLHIHLKPGPQTLDGHQAMEYVRFRHDRESDYGRQERQKEFLASFKSEVLHHVMKLPEIAEESKSAMGNALSDEEIIALVAFAKRVPQSSIRMGMLPTTEGSRRGAPLRVDTAKRDSALREFDLLPQDSRTAEVDR